MRSHFSCLFYFIVNPFLRVHQKPVLSENFRWTTKDCQQSPGATWWVWWVFHISIYYWECRKL